MDDGERTTNYGLPKKTVKACIPDSAYTYKVQEGYTVIKIRKDDGTVRELLDMCIRNRVYPK